MTGYRLQPDGSNSISIEARYLCGADGMRVKKWVRRGNVSSNDTSTVYIDGIFEHHRWQNGGGGQNNSLHVMDDKSRIAMVHVGSRHPDDGGEQVTYHLGDHLGSSHLVVGGDDVTGHTFINFEEFYSYGETSFGSFGRKRYRYSGKERDEESGLYYYGSRYLAPWLARWVSCDPIGINGGLNEYTAFIGNPHNFFDHYGEQAEPTESEIDAQMCLATEDVCNVENPADSEVETTNSIKGGWRNNMRAIIWSLAATHSAAIDAAKQANPDARPPISDAVRDSTTDPKSTGRFARGQNKIEPPEGWPRQPPKPTGQLGPGPKPPAQLGPGPTPPAQLGPGPTPPAQLGPGPTPPAQLTGRAPQAQLPPASSSQNKPTTGPGPSVLKVAGALAVAEQGAQGVADTIKAPLEHKGEVGGGHIGGLAGGWTGAKAGAAGVGALVAAGALTGGVGLVVGLVIITAAGGAGTYIGRETGTYAGRKFDEAVHGP